MLDFYCSRGYLFDVELICVGMALNIFLDESGLDEKARFLGELMLIFCVWVKVILVLVVILGYEGTFFILI